MSRVTINRLYAPQSQTQQRWNDLVIARYMPYTKTTYPNMCLCTTSNQHNTINILGKIARNDECRQLRIQPAAQLSTKSQLLVNRELWLRVILHPQVHSSSSGVRGFLFQHSDVNFIMKDVGNFNDVQTMFLSCSFHQKIELQCHSPFEPLIWNNHSERLSLKNPSKFVDLTVDSPASMPVKTC